MKPKVCPRCGEPVSGGTTICMVCGQSLQESKTIPLELVAVVVLAVVGIVLAFILYPIFFGATTVTSTGDVRFTVTLDEGSATVEYGGTASDREVANLRIAILAEGGSSSKIFSITDPQPGSILGPVEISTSAKAVGIYYVAVYDDGVEISNTIPI